jgi:hypothetical protein
MRGTFAETVQQFDGEALATLVEVMRDRTASASTRVRTSELVTELTAKPRRFSSNPATRISHRWRSAIYFGLFLDPGRPRTVYRLLEDRRGFAVSSVKYALRLPPRRARASDCPGHPPLGRGLIQQEGPGNCRARRCNGTAGERPAGNHSGPRPIAQGRASTSRHKKRRGRASAASLRTTMQKDRPVPIHP